MAESDGIQIIVNQVAMQVMTAVMMVLRDTNAGLWPVVIASLRMTETATELTSPRKAFIQLECPAQPYIEFLDFEMKATNIPEMRTHELTDEEKVLVIKNWLHWEGL